MFIFTLFCELRDIHVIKYFMKKLESSLCTILHWKRLIVEGGDFELPKIGAVKENSGADSPKKQGQ